MTVAQSNNVNAITHVDVFHARQPQETTKLILILLPLESHGETYYTQENQRPLSIGVMLFGGLRLRDIPTLRWSLAPGFGLNRRAPPIALTRL
jgi:hypothetical protein